MIRDGVISCTGTCVGAGVGAGVGASVGAGVGIGVGCAVGAGDMVGAGTHAPAEEPPQPRRTSPSAAHTSSSRSEHDSHPLHVSQLVSQLSE